METRAKKASSRKERGEGAASDSDTSEAISKMNRELNTRFCGLEEMIKGISSKLKEVQDKLIMLQDESREQKEQIDNLRTLGQERDLKIEILERKINENTRAIEQYKTKNMDLENRSCRLNLQIVGLREGPEGDNVI